MIFNLRQYKCTALEMPSAFNMSYVDDSSYYIMESHPAGSSFCSFTVRQFGTRINGKDGTVYNPELVRWERKGYVHLMPTQITGLITNGMSNFAVAELIGYPFKYQDSVGADKMTYTDLFFWTKDGELLIVLNQERNVIGMLTLEMKREMKTENDRGVTIRDTTGF